MVLARWQATITDEAGNIVPEADIEVRPEIPGQPLVPVFADREGTIPLGNPFPADGEGFAAFHVAGGAYRIRASSGAFERIWPYVGIGLAGESDVLTTGLAFRFDSATADSDPGTGNVRFNNAALASVTELYFANQELDGADVTAWLDSFDDGGGLADRGTLVLQGSDAGALLLCRVTGSVVDGTGYRRVSVAVLASSGSFAAGQSISLQFSPKGLDGTDGIDGLDGEIAGPGATTQAGQLAVFTDGNGNAIAGAETQDGAPASPAVMGSIAQVRAATDGAVIHGGHLRDAAAPVALVDGATVAINWTAGINFTLTVTANRNLGNPSDAIPGTSRTVLVQGNDGTDRALAFGSEYGGEVPSLTDIDSTKKYLLVIYCKSAGQFLVTAYDGSDA